MPNKKYFYPRIGIGVMIQNKKEEVLLGLRQGSHGAGEWSFPGGHLEFGETIFDAAKREVLEEVGLNIRDLNIISVADEMRYIKSDNKHYVNIGIKASFENAKVFLLEPDKCKKWQWFDLKKIPNNLFEGTELTIKNFLKGKIH